MSLTTTQNQLNPVVLCDPVFDDEQLIFAGAGTVKKGSLLARKVVDTAVVATANGGNTGNGTVTAVAVAGGDIVPKAGAYNLEVVEAILNGGALKLEDPDGNIISGNLIMAVSGAKTFTAGGLTFTVADGGTDFAVGDKFALTVVANGKMTPFLIAGTGGAQKVMSVLVYDVTATGAGNVSIRALVRGEVRQGSLLIDLDGTGANITQSHHDQLRSLGIVVVDVEELNILDNA